MFHYVELKGDSTSKTVVVVFWTLLTLLSCSYVHKFDVRDTLFS